MKAMQTLVLACGGYVSLGLIGCGHHQHHHNEEAVYVAPQPAYVSVAQPPPPVVVETRPHAPGGRYVWVDGYWVWRGDRYVWERGHWVVPPSGHRVWVAPRYERHDRGYRYAPGYWR